MERRNLLKGILACLLVCSCADPEGTNHVIHRNSIKTARDMKRVIENIPDHAEMYLWTETTLRFNVPPEITDE